MRSKKQAQMNLSGIPDFGFRQAQASWPKKSHSPQKSLKLFLHVGVSGSGRKLLVSPSLWGLLFYMKFLDVQRLSSPTVAAQLSPYHRPDSPPGWLFLFSFGWIHPTTVILPAPCLEVRKVDEDRDWAFKGLLRNQGLMSSVVTLT